MKGRPPSSRLDRGEEIGPGTRHPLARLGRRRSGRHVPGGREAAEVIEPNHVHVGQQGHAIGRCTSDSPTDRSASQS